MLAILALLACTPEAEVPVETVDTGTPDEERRCLVFEEERIDFGRIEWGVDPSTLEAIAHLRSHCDFDVWLEEVRVDTPDSPFAASFEHPALHPGETSEITIHFDPDGPGSWETSAVVYPVRAFTAWVDLRAEVVAPVIEVEPQSVDLGVPWVGCEVEAVYNIGNAGTSDLVVEDLEFVTGSADFSLDPREDSHGPLPWTVAPGRSVPAAIRYRPLDEFADTAFLTIESSDPMTPEILVTAKGTARIGDPGVIDTFVGPRGDVVLTVDRSDTMADYLVARELQYLAEGLWTGTHDVHAAVVVEDDGCLVGDPVTPSMTPEEVALALVAMADGEGTAGSLTRAGFSLAAVALDPASLAAGGCNEGLLHTGARLHLVHVSDGPESSVDPWSDYVSLFQGIDPHVIMYAVTGHATCGQADAGDGYVEAAAATGGQVLSLCDRNWGGALSLELRRRYLASVEPVPATIEVRVDGTRSTAWTYDATTQAVVFEEGHVPAVGSEVVLAYLPLPDCEETP